MTFSSISCLQLSCYRAPCSCLSKIKIYVTETTCVAVSMFNLRATICTAVFVNLRSWPHHHALSKLPAKKVLLNPTFWRPSAPKIIAILVLMHIFACNRCQSGNHCVRCALIPPPPPRNDIIFHVLNASRVPVLVGNSRRGLCPYLEAPLL